VLSIYASLGLQPPVGLIELLQGLPPNELALLKPAAQRAFDSAGGGQSAADVASHAALVRLLGSATP
jgi:hypothetical protein